MSGYIIPSDWDGESYSDYCLRWPDSPMWSELLRGALSGFSFADDFDQDTGDADEAASVGEQIIQKNNLTGEFPERGCNVYIVGEIKVFAGSSGSVPDGWLLCDGQSYDPDDYPDLYAVIGATYGLDQYGVLPLLPNLVERSPVGAGAIVSDNGNTFDMRLGKQTGEYSHLLTLANTPSHQHPLYVSGAGTPERFRLLTAIGTYQADNGYSQASGGGGYHKNVHPVLAVNFIIWTGRPS